LTPRRAQLALIAMLAAGCYRVTPPDQYACSSAEPLCPEGLHCNGSACVSNAPDGRAEVRIGDRRTSDGLDPCASWTAWTCDWMTNLLHGTSTCGNRTLDCTSVAFEWACTCKIGSAAPTTCPAPFEGVLLCGDVCPNAFSKGCCRP
jgi:hypothetical protein